MLHTAIFGDRGITKFRSSWKQLYLGWFAILPSSFHASWKGQISARIILLISVNQSDSEVPK